MPLDTELHKAAHKGDLDGVREFVLSGKIDVNEKGAQDRTALHRAAGTNHVSIIRFLLEMGAPIDCVDRCLRTPLHWAAISGNLDATELLLDCGSDLRLKTMSGMNPLMCAVQQKWYPVAETILDWSRCTQDEAGQDGVSGDVPNPMELCMMADAEGKTATMVAKEHKDIPMQKLLKAYTSQKSSSACCGTGAKDAQLAAVAPPQPRAGDGPAGAANPPNAERQNGADGAVPNAANGGRTKAANGATGAGAHVASDGVRRDVRDEGSGTQTTVSWFLPFMRCCGQTTENGASNSRSDEKDEPPPATATMDVDPSNSPDSLDPASPPCGDNATISKAAEGRGPSGTGGGSNDSSGLRSGPPVIDHSGNTNPPPSARSYPFAREDGSSSSSGVATSARSASREDAASANAGGPGTLASLDSADIRARGGGAPAPAPLAGDVAEREVLPKSTPKDKQQRSSQSSHSWDRDRERDGATVPRRRHEPDGKGGADVTGQGRRPRRPRPDTARTSGKDGRIGSHHGDRAAGGHGGAGGGGGARASSDRSSGRRSSQRTEEEVVVPTKSSAGPGAEWWDTADCTVEHEPSGGVVATGDYEESIRTTPSAGVEGRDDVGAVTSKEGAQSKTTADTLLAQPEAWLNKSSSLH